MNAPRRPAAERGSPITMPQGNPSSAAPFDHSFTLQAVMELQKTVAVLGEKIDRMSADTRAIESKVDGVEGKVDKLSHWQSRLLGGAAVLVVVITILWTVVNLVPWDRIKIEPKVASTTAATTPQVNTQSPQP